jgi:hypothetical protein
MIGYLISIVNLTLVEIGPEIEIQNYECVQNLV